MIALTFEDTVWLRQRGGRNQSDVLFDTDEHGVEGPLYVLMGNGKGGDMRVYLPKPKKTGDKPPKNGG